MSGPPRRITVAPDPAASARPRIRGIYDATTRILLDARRSQDGDGGRRWRRRLPGESLAGAAAVAAVAGAIGDAPPPPPPGIILSERSGGGPPPGPGIVPSAIPVVDTLTDLFAGNVLNPWYLIRRGNWTVTDALRSSTPGADITAILDWYTEVFGDVRVEVRGGAGGAITELGPIARGTYGGGGELSGYIVQQGPLALFLRRVDADIETTLATAFGAAPPTSRLEVRCVGTTISAWRDGLLVTSAVDATYAAGTCGVYRRDGATGTECTRLIAEPAS